MDIQSLINLISASQAVYSKFNLAFLADNLQTKDGAFTEKEADEFVKRYEIVAPLESTASGFQAILFKDKIDNKYVFAIRGSEQLAEDFAYADVGDIGRYGYAAAQSVDMYRYWKKLTSPFGVAVAYTQSEVSQLYLLTHPVLGLANIVTSAADYVLLANSLKNDIGMDKLSASQKVDITAHSLGGNLASVFASMFPSNVNQIVTINAPSINGGLGNIQGVGVTGQDLLMLMGFSRVDQSKIISLTGEGDLVHLTSGSQIGSVVNISQEVGHQAIDGLSNNHSVINGLDALNLMNLFSKLDPSQKNNPSGILNEFMRASSNQTIDTYENMLDGLRRILLGDSFIKTTTAGYKNNLDARNELYNNIDELSNRITNGDLNYLVDHVKFIKSSSDTDAAKKSYSQFLSLYYLTPFVLDGKDSDLKFFDLGLYQAWYSDTSLNAEDRNNGKANFSDRWYEDRASMLRAQVARNTDDADSDTHTNKNPYTIYYHDAANNTDVKSEASIHPAYENSAISFGDDLNNSLTGTFFNDRLYGGLGNDTLKGMEGYDYIEGGGGDDLLYGGEGADQLYGNTGDDQLVGEGGNDVLMGGQGNDTYIFTGQFGHDIIKDSDNQGSIEISGAKLSSLTQLSKDSIVYYNDINNPTIEGIVIDEGDTKSLIIYTVTKNGYNITKTGNSITIKNWSDGALGLTLNSTADAQIVLPVIAGGDGNDALGPNRTVINTVDTSLATDIRGGKGNDYIFGSMDADIITGGDDNDWISATPGETAMPGPDTIDGGAGNDLILGSTWQSVWRGGDGRDILIASAGSITSQQGVPRSTLLRDFNQYLKVGYTINTTQIGNGAVYSYEAWAGFEPGVYTSEKNILGETYRLTITGNNALANPNKAQSFLSQYDYYYSDAQHNNATLEIFDNSNGGQWKSIPFEFRLSSMNDPTAASRADALTVTSFGGAGDDLLLGSYLQDQLYGGADNDYIYGNMGNDIIDGGAGNDTLFGGQGDDLIIGGAGNDILTGDDGASNAGNDTLYGGSGNDTLAGYSGNDYLDGGTGSDYLIGGDGNDYLYGGDDDEVDHLIGGADDDILIVGKNDVADGGSGNNIYIWDTHQVTTTPNNPATPAALATTINSTAATLNTTPNNTLGFNLNDTLSNQVTVAAQSIRYIYNSEGNNTLGISGVGSLDTMSLFTSDGDLSLLTSDNQQIVISNAQNSAPIKLVFGNSVEQLAETPVDTTPITDDHFLNGIAPLQQTQITTADFMLAKLLINNQHKKLFSSTQSPGSSVNIAA